MKKMIKIAVFLIIVLLVTLLLPTFSPALGTLMDILSNIFIAAGFAYVSYPLVKFLRKHGFNNGLASFITLLVFLSVLTLAIFLIIQLVYPQIIRAIQLVQDTSGSISWIRDNPDIQRIFDYLSPYFDQFSSTVLNYFAGTTQDVISNSIKFIVDAAMIIALYLYILFDNEKIIQRIKNKLGYGSRRYNFVKNLDHEFIKYLRGLLIIILITVIEYGIVYRVIGHPDWMALAALCAFANLIPYFGGIIVNLIALVTSIFVSYDLFLMVLACVIILPVIEGNFINPMVHRKTIKINPIVLLPSIFVGANLFGFLGIILAIPAIIFYKVFKKFYMEDVKRYLKNAWHS